MSCEDLPLSKRRKLKLPFGRGMKPLLLLGIVVLVYFSSFHLLVIRTGWTFGCDNRHGDGGFMVTIETRHFSDEPTLNRILYVLYWPIHRFLMPNARPTRPIQYCDEFPSKPIYLWDVEGI
jgi:hypothetical protein